MKTGMLLLVLLMVPAIAAAQSEPKGGPGQAGSTPQSSVDQPTQARIAGDVVIGERAPDFEADAVGRKPVMLSKLRGDWVLLVFSERKEDLLPLDSLTTEARKLGALIVGVADEKLYHLAPWAEKEGVEFILLSDDLCQVGQMYGLYDADKRTLLPGFVIIDRQGIVQMALLGYSLPAAEVFAMLAYAIHKQP